MRKRYCKGRYYKAGAYHDFQIGKFHQWGSNYEEFENGAGNYSVAIVELPDEPLLCRWLMIYVSWRMKQ